MVEIVLGNGGVAIVDDEDARLASLRWSREPRGYAIRRPGKRGEQQLIRMHRVVLGVVDPAVQVDHINGDPLDNRRANLRVATPAQNAQNVRRAGGSSPHRGVSWYRKYACWRAAGRINGRSYHLGYFDDDLAAARASEAFRRQHMTHAGRKGDLDPLPPCSCRMCRPG
jgi:hypothetical protein